MRFYKVKMTNGDEYVALAEWTEQAEQNVRLWAGLDKEVRSVEPIPENYVTRVTYGYKILFTFCFTACTAATEGSITK